MNDLIELRRTRANHAIATMLRPFAIAALSGALVAITPLFARSASPATSAKCRPALPASGDVLIAGGGESSSTAAAEFFDPATQQFFTACNMHAAREASLPLVTQAIVGKKVVKRILVIGGEKRPRIIFRYSPFKTTDSYNEVTGKFQSGPTMKQSVAYGAAVPMDDGKVFIAVGLSAGGCFLYPSPPCAQPRASNLAMTYDPVKSNFKLLKNGMSDRRAFAAAALIGSGPNTGKVLIAGGWDYPFGILSSADLFDESTGTFSAASPMITARRGATATTLLDGSILVAGGTDGPVPSAEIYDPLSGMFVPTTFAMNGGHAYHTATLLKDGTVLIAGGGTSAAEVYDPATGKFTVVGDLNTPRTDHSATLFLSGVLSGQVLIAGGDDSAVSLTTAELYNPTTKTFSFTTTNMLSAHSGHAAALLP